MQIRRQPKPKMSTCPTRTVDSTVTTAEDGHPDGNIYANLPLILLRRHEFVGLQTEHSTPNHPNRSQSVPLTLL